MLFTMPPHPHLEGLEWSAPWPTDLGKLRHAHPPSARVSLVSSLRSRLSRLDSLDSRPPSPGVILYAILNYLLYLLSRPTSMVYGSVALAPSLFSPVPLNSSEKGARPDAAHGNHIFLVYCNVPCIGEIGRRVPNLLLSLLSESWGRNRTGKWK